MNKTGIVLFVYKRSEHTKKVLDALRRNNIDHLYVFCDGPKENASEDDIIKIKDVIKIVESIDWCKTEIVKSDKNKGLRDSEIFGINYVLDRHDRIIILEDDCLVTSDFIDFMEKCLDRYENDERVMNITGYTAPFKMIKNYPYDIYFTYRSGSHGQAIYKRAWKKFEQNKDDFYRITNSKELRKKIDLAGVDLYYFFKFETEGRINSVGLWWSWSIIKNNGICVNPVKSRVQDLGHDGTGVHGEKTNRYLVKIDESKLNKEIRFPETIEVNPEINKRFNEFLTGKPIYRISRKILKVFSLRFWLNLFK